VAKRKSPKTKTCSLAEVRRELAEVARVGQMFMDGDLARRVYHPHAECFMKGDDMDFNPEAFLPLKKTMMRLERLARIPCGTTLWRRRPDMPECGEAAIYGCFASPLGGSKPANRGYQPQPMFPELAAAFLKGRCTWKTTPARSADIMAERGMGAAVRGVNGPAFIEHFVPVKDSLGEIAGVLEVFAAVPGKKRRQAR
jgi:hypothetical protein